MWDSKIFTFVAGTFLGMFLTLFAVSNLESKNEDAVRTKLYRECVEVGHIDSVCYSIVFWHREELRIRNLQRGGN